MVKVLNILLSLMMISTFCFTGCTNGSDSYVKGLICLENKETSKAVKNFKKSINKGTDIEVLLSLKELNKLKLNPDKMLRITKKALKLKSTYPEVYNYYLQSLVDAKKYKQVIKIAPSLISSNLDLQTDWIKYCYAYSLAKTNSSLDNNFILNWLTQDNFTEYKNKFFEKFSKDSFFL